VISGELDDQTSMADGEAAAGRYPLSRHVVIANSFHVNALPHARSACAAGIVQRFMAELEAGDVGCAAAVPPVPLVTRFARHLPELEPAAAAQGNEAGPQALRAVSAGVFTCADVITRAAENGGGAGLGLRGGAFTAVRQGEGYRLTLREVRWTEDLAVSGRIEWPGRVGMAHAQLELHSGRESGRLELSWPEGVNGARVRASGTFAGKAVAAEAAAP
jgi:hypothetical protein